MMKLTSLVLAFVMLTVPSAPAQQIFTGADNRQCDLKAGIFELRRCTGESPSQNVPDQPSERDQPPATDAVLNRQLVISSEQGERATQSGQLAIRCRNGNLSVLIAFDGQIMGNQGRSREIVFSFDGGAKRLLEMSRATDHSILGVWRGLRARPFIQDMITGRSLSVQAENADGQRLQLRFAIDGVADRVHPIIEACQV